MTILVLLAAHGAIPAIGSEDSAVEQFRKRRDELRAALPDGITVLFGRTEKDSDDLRSGFFQEPNFYYLSGWSEPGAILLLAPGPRNALPKEILFIPKRSPEQEKWTGPKKGPEDPEIRGITGFETVLAAESFESELGRMLQEYPRIYTLAGSRRAANLRTLAPLREVADATTAIARLRMKKSPQELTLIERATEATLAAHRAAWKRIAPGLFEYQIAATMSETYLEQGCERAAYAPIVAAGPNATTLHYSNNRRRMDAGELLLMDVGAECAGYAADITRTVPVNGKFSKRQKELYNIVLGAQQAVIAAVKPGMMLGKSSPNSLYQIAYDYLNTHGKDLHGEPLGKYFTHGVSHHIGLEVHDAFAPNVALEAGMVITVEPGLYIPEEKIGIRIEDMVLVTADGSRVLSAGLPRDPEAIEKALAK